MEISNKKKVNKWEKRKKTDKLKWPHHQFELVSRPTNPMTSILRIESLDVICSLNTYLISLAAWKVETSPSWIGKWKHHLSMYGTAYCYIYLIQAELIVIYFLAACNTFNGSIQASWVKRANEWIMMTTEVINSNFSYWTCLIKGAGKREPPASQENSQEHRP